MKVAFILPSLANKGPVLVCKDIVKEIVGQVELCTVYYFDDVVEVEFPCQTQRISFFGKINLNNYDVVHSHMFRPDLFLFLRSWHIGKMYKTVSTIHTAIYDDLAFAYSKAKSIILPGIWKKAWNSFNSIVVLSKFAQTYYKDLKPRVTIIPNGRSISQNEIEVEDKAFIDSLKQTGKLIGTVASFDDRKGLDQVVRALEHLKDFRFIIVGNGQESIKNKLCSIADELSVKDRLFFLGPRKNGDRYIPQFDIFIIPSISEGFPLALLEAIAHKTPVVCSNIEVFTEVLTNDAVSYFDLFDTQGLINAILKADKNRESMVSLAYETYCQKYTSYKMGKNYLRLYNELL